MPNWCVTYVCINYNNEDKIKDLYNKIVNWTSKNYMNNGFGTSWLGNVVLGSEVGTVDTDPKTDVECRGSIDFIDHNDTQIQIQTETAWVPMLAVWQKVIDKYLPGAKIIYDATEHGNGIYYTNDLELKDCYYIDPYDTTDIEPDYEASEENVVELLQNVLKTDEDSVEVLLEKLVESECAYELGIHKWEYVDPAELD